MGGNLAFSLRASLSSSFSSALRQERLGNLEGHPRVRNPAALPVVARRDVASCVTIRSILGVVGGLDNCVLCGLDLDLVAH